VLEHLSHPLDFLISIRKGMINGAELIMSVPNAFYVEDFIHILLGKEKVHPEHVAYYSYNTIVQLIERAALEVKDVTPCKYQAINPKKRLTDMLQKPFLWFSPNFAPGYVVKAIAVSPYNESWDAGIGAAYVMIVRSNRGAHAQENLDGDPAGRDRQPYGSPQGTLSKRSWFLTALCNKTIKNK
jgi:hypothetical protein